MSTPEAKPDYQRIDELEQECVIIGRYRDMWCDVLALGQATDEEGED